MKYADCEKCVHARVTTTGGMTVRNGVMIIQQAGGKNITCRAGTIQTITMTDEGMVCSSFRERNTENGISKQRGVP